MHLAQKAWKEDQGREGMLFSSDCLSMMSGLFESGSSWTQFEDQALVVLVHDMGPNWELVSDVINSTLQFKVTILLVMGLIMLMIPGLANPIRRLYLDQSVCWSQWKRIRIKAHFEKIISIGQHQHSRKIQKQTVPVHNSHVLALSQVCPSNLTGSLLIFAANPDLSHGYQGSHSSSLGIANQGYVAPVLPTSGLVLVLSPCYKDLLLYLLVIACHLHLLHIMPHLGLHKIFLMFIMLAHI
ncbi:hypothetical protein MKW92_030051 [Papaver armeniacum]|nr:hypothetical protein MKW92_030051 [Papaver armeniacum]